MSSSEEYYALQVFRADTKQEINVFNIDFPTDTGNVKFRAVQWITAEIVLALAAIVNILSRW